jgi:hypothetical protein
MQSSNFNIPLMTCFVVMEFLLPQGISMGLVVLQPVEGVGHRQREVGILSCVAACDLSDSVLVQLTRFILLYCEQFLSPPKFCCLFFPFSALLALDLPPFSLGFALKRREVEYTPDSIKVHILHDVSFILFCFCYLHRSTVMCVHLP